MGGARYSGGRPEEAVDQLDRDRPLSGHRGHPLDGSMPDIARRKHARHARFEPQPAALEWPRVVVREIRAREQETLSVSGYLRGQPIGLRAGPDQHEEPIGGDRLVFSGRGLAKHQVLESPVASAADHLAAKADFHVRRRLHFLHQIVGHPRAERLSAHQERDLAGVARQVQRRLPR